MLTPRATRRTIVVLLLCVSILVIARHTLLAAEPMAGQAHLFAQPVTNDILRSSARPLYFWDPRISIIWPHDGQGHPTDVAHSRAVNVSVWPSVQVNCKQWPEMTLLMAKDNEPWQPFFSGQMILRTVNGVTFPSMEFNNIPADLVAEPTAQFRFTIYSEEDGWRGNVWVHAADSRTFLPHPVIPTGIEPPYRYPGAVDARIQIVWPHDEQGQFAPVDQAPLVNIAVGLFTHETLNSVPLEYQWSWSSERLAVAAGNGPLELIDREPQKITYEVNGQTFPRWVFNDIPVRPGQQYHFMVVQWPRASTALSSNVWTHAPDARTILPTPEVPPPCKG